jgi:hypothetical protein
MASIAFPSWRSFWHFRREVMSDWRYRRTPEAQAFLDIVAAQSHERTTTAKAGRTFYRAQVDHKDHFDAELGDYLPGPALPDRMIPRPDRAGEGRANPKGIPCLYMASDVHTALAEVRPWIGSLVTVALLEIVRDLHLVNCTANNDSVPSFFEEPPPEKRNEAVWSHIARAFREPALRDEDRAEYAPTQIIAEVFRAEGFDGLGYRTAFGTDRFNLAVFSLKDAELLQCTLQEITDIELKYAQSGNPYYVVKNADGSVSLVRNVIRGIEPVGN